MAAESSELETSQLPKKNLKTLLDARKIGDGGIGVYIENTARGLLKYTDVEPTLLVSSEQISQKHSWLSDFELVVDSSKPYSLDEYFSLRKRVDFSSYSLFHTPHYTLPYKVPIPTVVTVHDLIHITHPERFYYPFIAKRLIKSALRRADKVVTVSRASEYDLAKLAGKKLSDKIVTIPNAATPENFNKGSHSEFIAKRFKLDGAFFLLVASNLKPHKGVEDAIKAFSNLKRTCRNYPELKSCADIKLALVGFGAERIANISSYLDLISNEKSIYLLGSVSKEELTALYGAAHALLVASTAEGFCLPAIEAHSQGTPIVVRPVPAVKELLTSVDICCDDFNLSSLERGMREMLLKIQDGGVLTEAERLIHLQQFDLEAVSNKLADVYHKVIENS